MTAVPRCAWTAPLSGRGVPGGRLLARSASGELVRRGVPRARGEGPGPPPRPSILACYAAFTSVVVGGVVETGIVASIGTTFPFPIRLADFHAAKIFGSAAAALFT